jgi:hypothetical protein
MIPARLAPGCAPAGPRPGGQREVPGYRQTAVKSAVTGAAFPALSVTTPW